MASVSPLPTAPTSIPYQTFPEEETGSLGSPDHSSETWSLGRCLPPCHPLGGGSILVPESAHPAYSSVSSFPLLDQPLTKPYCPNPDRAPKGDTGQLEGMEPGPRLSASPPWQVGSPRGRQDSLGPRVRWAGWPAPQVPPSPWAPSTPGSLACKQGCPQGRWQQ